MSKAGIEITNDELRKQTAYNGGQLIDDANNYTINASSIYFLEDTIIASISGNISGNLTGRTFTTNQIIFGLFIQIRLLSGACIAYNTN